MSTHGADIAREAQQLDTTQRPAVDEAPYRRALIVANPIAGRGKGAEAARELEEGLRQLGVPTAVQLTRTRGDAQEMVASCDPEVDLVVAVGGDGTLREVLEGLNDAEVPVGILPLGTANVLAHELGLPRDVHATLEILAEKHTRKVDVATVNGELSFMVTGVGVDAMTVREVERSRRGPITKFSYFGPVLRTLSRYRAPRLKVEVDGEGLPEEYGLVLVSNTINYGGLLNLDAETRLDDGRFEVYLFRAQTIWALLAYGLRGLLGRLPGGLGELRRARSVKITAAEPVPYQIDGDYRGETPLDITVSDCPVRLLVPRPR